MSWYGRWMLHWEQGLNQRVTSRRPRPFGWGAEYITGEGFSGTPQERMTQYADWAFRNSETFYALPHLPIFQMESNRLTFPSVWKSDFPENDTVHGRYFPCPTGKAAVLVLPQWNADTDGHMALCRLLNRFGLSALRLSLPYHDARRPPGMDRADYIVDANIGRTLQVNRQAVCDVRCALKWLQQIGHGPIGIIGTSLGACIAFLTFVHEPLCRTAIYNLGSSWFSDVVWHGNTTPHVRQGLKGQVTLEELRHYWAAISPLPLIERLRGDARPQLLISGKYDCTFLPDQVQDFVRECRRCRLPLRQIILPCGHYTLGRFPFNWLDGLLLCTFMRRKLS